MKKTFDCVEIKNEIQHQLQAEYAGLTLAEQKKKMNQEILSDPILGPMYRRLLAKRTGDAVLKVAEEPGRYKTGK
jgi:hypothetical protein